MLPLSFSPMCASVLLRGSGEEVKAFKDAFFFFFLLLLVRIKALKLIFFIGICQGD